MKNREFQYVWFGKSLVKSADALIHVASPSARYGLSVFEGIRAYRSIQNDGIVIFRLQDHIDRLFQSAKALSLPLEMSQKEILSAVEDTLIKNEVKEDSYIRLDALSAGLGSWSSEEPATITITVKSVQQRSQEDFNGIKAEISEWRRIDSSQMPPSVKAGANYINSRYAFLDSKKRGYDVPIFLNLKGFVSESSGACVMAVSNGILKTPPLTAQVLDSITRDTILKIANVLNIESLIVDITPEEIIHSDEIFICGTAAEITPVTRINLREVSSGQIGKVTKKLLEGYHQATRSSNSKVFSVQSTFIGDEKLCHDS
jgi:branched-chain amino acid aminotransferase